MIFPLFHWTAIKCSSIFLLFLLSHPVRALKTSIEIVSNDKLEEPWTQKCPEEVRSVSELSGCAPLHCTRYVVDDFVSKEDVDILLGMMKRGMASSSQDGGPTIMDVNSGFLKDSEGLITIYKPHRGLNRVNFTAKEYEIYGNLFEKIRNKIIELNKLDYLYFTAPTFVARLIGNPEWEPAEIHDEYWHPHVDQDNTPHYFYSGLVYLSDHGADFTGGEFKFIDNEIETTVLPRKGRFITFTSGRENLHKVAKVKTGTRFTLSMWFTCNEERQFSTFLDGEAHASYKATVNGAPDNSNRDEL